MGYNDFSGWTFEVVYIVHVSKVSLVICISLSFIFILFFSKSFLCINLVFIHLSLVTYTWVALSMGPEPPWAL